MIDDLIALITSGQSLTAIQAEALFNEIFAGGANKNQIREILIGLHNKGEDVSEIQGAVTSMRNNMIPILAPEGAIDIVGTGGDGQNTLNISTATAFVVAGAGVPVAKHGNRAATSLSGSSDVLTELGIHIEAPLPVIEEALHTIGITFLFAPRHHPSMRFVAPIRKTLGIRTIFNLLGPMTNPANVKLHMIGVFDVRWSTPMVETLKTLGSKRAWVVHGHDGLDELSTTGASAVCSLADNKISNFMISPDDFGLQASTIDRLRGGNAKANAAAVMRLLDGEKGPYRDIVLLNAAASLCVANHTIDIKEALLLAAQSIDSGAAKEKRAKLAQITKE